MGRFRSFFPKFCPGPWNLELYLGCPPAPVHSLPFCLKEQNHQMSSWGEGKATGPWGECERIASRSRISLGVTDIHLLLQKWSCTWHHFCPPRGWQQQGTRWCRDTWGATPWGSWLLLAPSALGGGGAGGRLSGLPGVTEEEGAVTPSSLTFYLLHVAVAGLPGQAAGPLLIRSGSQSLGAALPAARRPGLVSQPVGLCPPALCQRPCPASWSCQPRFPPPLQQAVLKPLHSWSLCLSDDSHSLLCRLLMPYYIESKFFSFSLPN